MMWNKKLYHVGYNWVMKLVTVNQMREIEKQANASGVSYAEMMEHAGRGLAQQIEHIAFDKDWNEALGLVGAGNNGGDTLVALTYLVEAGWTARAYILNRGKNDELTARFLSAGGEVIYAESDADFYQLNDALVSAQVLLDGLLGTGIKLPLKEQIAKTLEQCHFILADLDEPPYIVAVDCPSGVDCDTGEAALEALPANLTVTMAAVKQGMLKLPAFELLGELALVEIGLPDDLPAFADLQIEVADANLVSGLLPDRELDSHKGAFGTALIAAGSLNYTGAAYLSGSAAYRVGAGLVTLAVPAPLHAALAGHLPEATWVLLPHESGFIAGQAAADLLNSVRRATAFLLGPGLGFHTSTQQFVEEVIGNINLPAVIDADGLRHIRQIPNWHEKLKHTTVLTPHVGEMSMLTGLSKDEIQSNRNEIALQYAKQWGHVIVLKGAFTAIAAPDGKMTIIPVATPALARAGTGDVLAGVIVGLRAQGLDAYDAAVAGAYIHAQAGLLAADDLGASAAVTASDVLNSIADIISELE